VRNFKPDVIGFSCYIWNYKETIKFCDKIKKINPNILIVLGGPCVSSLQYSKEVLKKNPSVDVVVRYDGEVTFYEIIKNLVDSNRNFSNILGITYRNKNKIVANPPRPLLENLDEIPSPYTSGIYEKYILSENSKHLTFFDPTNFLMETSRGCPFNCSYCFEKNRSSGKVRFFSLERVREELNYLSTRVKTINSIYFTDSIINIKKQRLIELCEMLIQKKFRYSHIYFEIRPEILDSEMIENIRKIGNLLVECGIQTTNKKAGTIIHRDFDENAITRNIKAMQEKGIRVVTDLIKGLPGDNLAGLKESLYYNFKLNPDLCVCFTLQIFPGTEIYEMCKKYHCKFDENNFNRIISSDTWSEKDLDRASRLVKLIQNFQYKKNILNFILRYSYLRLVIARTIYNPKAVARSFINKVEQLIGMI
jgi:radical SAM superfamily enzyme YgiQ (UPF0313 family)